MYYYYLDYILCYKEAFILGMATGLLIAALMNKRKRNAYQ